MPHATENPLVYEVFTRVFLADLAREHGRPMTLADIPDAVLDRFESLGFDYLYLMGVWTLGEEAPAVSGATASEPLPGEPAATAAHIAALRAEYDRALPGWTVDDIVGSPFSVARYAVAPSLGGDDGLTSLRARLAARGIGLLLDFVPNHVAPDHPFVKEKPELFVRGAGGQLMAGRDPYFPPWLGTAQLDYRLASTRAVVLETLQAIAERCDGVRCDMAMLVLDQQFRKTWSASPPLGPDAPGEFWAQAIDAVRARRPDFLFVAEAYWDLEWRLQLLGFDYTYDKSLYDRLIHGSAALVRGHLRASSDYQRRSLRFVENHDEARVAAVLPTDHAMAASVIAATAPGMRLFEEGQLDGRRVRASVHLSRRAIEPQDKAVAAFYERLFAALRRPALRRGRFASLTPQELAKGRREAANFVVYRWEAPRGALETGHIVVAANLSPAKSAARIPLDLPGLAGRRAYARDLLSDATVEGSGDAWLDQDSGLTLTLPAYGVQLLEVGPCPASDSPA